MAVEYEISSDVAVIKETGSVSQCARVTQMYSGQITYDDEAGSKFATATINGKSQRVMLCIAVNGTVNYDDVPSLYSTVDGHRCLNIVTPTETGTPDDVPSLYETVVIDGQNVRAVRCIMINKTPVYDGVSSTCTFTGDDGKTHTAQLVNKITGGSVVVVIKGTSPLNLPDAIANSLSYVKAYGGTEQRNIPYNYIEQQFIYMMDGSYLLTDLVPTYDCKIEMDFQTTTLPSAPVYFFGGRTETYGGLFFARTVNAGFIVDAFGARYNSNISVSNNTRYKFTYDNQVAKVESAGTTLFTNTFTGTGETGAAFCINGLNTSGAITTTNTGIYLYSFKVWNAQGELVADYVPAVQKGTVPVVGFYDTVSKTFKTATAGTFAAGGEAVPSPDAPMDIVCNNGVLKARHQSGLPLSYTLLEGIENDQDTYVDTGIVPVIDDVDMEIRIKPSSGPWYILQNRASGGAVWGISGSNTGQTILLSWAGSGGLCQSSITRDTTHTYYIKATLKNGNATLYVKDETDDIEDTKTNTYTSAVPTLPFWLFGNQNNNRVAAGNEVYMARIKVGGVTVMDYVPVLNSSNVVGFYDKVSKTFVQNSAGSLIAGSTIPDPVEIYTDGTVETIVINGNNLFDKTNYEEINAYVNANTGVLTQGSPGATTQYCAVIPCEPNTTYKITGRGISAWGAFTEKTIGTTATSFDKETGIITTGANDLYLIGLVRANNDAIDYRNTLSVNEISSTATAEMLLKVGDYQDEQEILSGAVTRNVGVLVLDGTEEDLAFNTQYNVAYFYIPDKKIGAPNFTPLLCSHLKNNSVPFAQMGYGEIASTVNDTGINMRVSSSVTSLVQFKSWLADQYAAGTPVIVVYPLATATTESVTGQTLQVQDGDNTLEITQASLNNLELEAEYQAAVSLTIQEVQDANLDPNVEVTIN